MHVVATAGHVDHGKSALVRALTGMEPDRWESERRRGLTIDLGFAWTTMKSGQQIAFVDVPGHERFITNMLAGVGPVPSVMFVVAADEGWKPQSSEHRDALNALGVRSGILVITRCDLADPSPALNDAVRQLERTSLAGLDSVCVSAKTGEGLDTLATALERLAAAVPPPEIDGPVRLWIDRVFTVRGAGTVVTGTLPTGTVSVGQNMRRLPAGESVEIRGIQSLEQSIERAYAVSRVAVNLRGVDKAAMHRGDVLVTPDSWTSTDLVDARLPGGGADAVPNNLTIHIGAASLPVRVRRLGGAFFRILLSRRLPLHIGDRAILRDPAMRRIIGGLEIVDVLPPALNRRGAGPARAAELLARPNVPGPLMREGIIRSDMLRMTGVPDRGLKSVTPEWLADPLHWNSLKGRLTEILDLYLPEHPLDVGMPVDAVRRALSLPDIALVPPLVAPPLAVRGGHVIDTRQGLTPELRLAMEELRADLLERPFIAPEANRLHELGLGRSEQAALVRAEELWAVGPGIYLLPGTERVAAVRLSRLSQPFTVSQARMALGTTRRVAVPLLEWLDLHGRTTRLPDGTRRITGR